MLLVLNALVASSVSAPHGQSTKISPADTVKSQRPKYSVRRTSAETTDDIKQRSSDLRDPANVTTEVSYNEKDNTYSIGTTLNAAGTQQQGSSNASTTNKNAKTNTTSSSQTTTGTGSNSSGSLLPISSLSPLHRVSSYLTVPILMTQEEYRNWSLKQSMARYFRSKNTEAYESQGKNKFDFTDMHFDLGPAEKIFGPGGVQIKTQGTAELKMGMNMKNVDNPSLAVSRRKTTGFDFDMKINLSLKGSVGDKVNLNLNYNTDATFDFDSQNLKLKYDGKEDEIIKLIEAGNVTFPSNNSLMRGASSLFGLRTDMQFGRLKLQTVVSQKKSATKSVSSKGGSSTNPFEFSATEYEENRHFFLSHFFRQQYDKNMRTLPTISSGINITRIEVWVTNKTASTTNNRNVIALTDLAESSIIGKNAPWVPGTDRVPSNQSNNEYQQMITTYADARDISQATTVLDQIPGFEGSVDYEKLQSARLLSSSEYYLNPSLGYISLNSTLQTDEVLAVAYEFTYNGRAYQVGEFSNELSDNSKALYVKLLKGTTASPTLPNWRLMMKNVYSLGATSTTQEKFRLDIKYQSDSAGVYLTYLPEQRLKNTTLLKALGLDRLDAKNHPNSNGQFDYVENFTIRKGRIIFPVAEPFGEALASWIGDPKLAEKYCFPELYDSTKTQAKQIAEHDKFLLTGQYKGQNGSVIDLGATNIAQGSVLVTAGGVTLNENTDYTVDYNMGTVTIINQSIIDAGTNVNASVESNDNYGMQRKTMLGVNADYEFSKNLTLGASLMYLNEQPLTTKVNMGTEPLKNTLWGAHISWKTESQWLTNMLAKLPLIHCTQPSSISFNGEFAQLVAGQNRSIQGGASYLDDFESSTMKESLTKANEWMMSSTPRSIYPSNEISLDYGKKRALLAWYEVDPIFTRRSSTLTPAHIKSDMTQLSNHYVREVYERELYPQKAQNSYSNANSLPVLNLAYYPNERGAYNLSTDLNPNGTLKNPAGNWGGMMRKMDNPDFETMNVEYIEFWMMDPFIYNRRDNNMNGLSGTMHINLGEVSEDILKDGKKYFESGMPVDGNPQYYSETIWGRVPNNSTSVTYAFNNDGNARKMQDIGLNGLSSEEEISFPTYADYLDKVKQIVNNADVLAKMEKDPANDNYHYYRGSDYDRAQVSILDRYKRINMPEGNSPDSQNSPESYETAYKTTPDVEDINQDYTLNEYEKYFDYEIPITPHDTIVGVSPYLVDRRITSVKLRNGETENCTWYLYRVPIKQPTSRMGSINDFTSIRFMRVYLTGFEQPVVLRFATLDLVHGDWRPYEQALYANATPVTNGKMTVATVNIEENNDKTPVNYVLPPGISRVTDPSQSQLVEENEQALSLTVTNLDHGDACAVYKNCKFDMRRYKHLQLFVHANALEPNITNLNDGETSVFLRLGSDYKSNFYEYEVPLHLTPAGHYDTYSAQGCNAVWPQENMIDLDLDVLTNAKKNRNRDRAHNLASNNELYEDKSHDNPNRHVYVMGNPSLGEVKTIMIGVRNNGQTAKSVEVWVNELRLQEFSNEGGWAAQGTLNIQLSDLGSVNAAGHIETAGFGGIEQSVADRSDENRYNYSVTTSFDLGKVLPDAAKVNLPLYYSYQKEVVKPKYNPLDTDMLLSEAFDALATQQQKDSLLSLTTTSSVQKNLSLSGVKINIASRKHPMPYDPANFTFNYSHSSTSKEGVTTVYEREKNWKGGISYSWTPNWKPWEPFKKLKGKSKWLDIIKDQNIAFAPQSLTFNTDLTRNYYELQERDIDNLEHPTSLPVNFSSSFLWNRDFQLRWDIFKALHFTFQSATHAEVEEPYTPINKDLYPDSYQAWKDSVSYSLRNFGRPLDYNQSAQLSYKIPIHRIPCFDWINADATYNAPSYWKRGVEREDGATLGHPLNTQRTVNGNLKFNLETLYNHSTFLKETNKRFSASNARSAARKKVEEKKREDEAKRKQKEAEKEARQKAEEESAKTGVPVDTILARQNAIQTNARGKSPQKVDTKKTKGFAGEVQLKADTTVVLAHNQRSKRLIITARDADGHPYNLKYKTLDDNKIVISNLDTVKVRVNVTAKPKLEDEKWYSMLQATTRFLMMVRNVSVSYRNTYNLALPGFLPEVGDMLGQYRGTDGLFRPGIDFGFGMVGDSYLERAKNNGWLLCADSVATPATSATTEDLQVKASLEPFTDLKIDLNASWTRNQNKSVQYMYQGNPTTRTGSFNMTTITIATAFQSAGNADNGYHSAAFDQFRNNLTTIQQRVEQRYAGTTYPAGSGQTGLFNPDNGTVSPYSPDVMIPAFLAAYSGRSAHGASLNLFPAMKSMLPNWSISYKGLSNLPWLRDNFKSVTITHGYKSVFAIGAYNTYTSWLETIGGQDMGFIQNSTTGELKPSSPYDISTCSINESFTPLIGVNVTFQNNMTAKLEYKTTRVLTLSMTSAQVNETSSKDIVFGWGYKIADFKIASLFGGKKASEKAKGKARSKKNGANDEEDNKNKRNSATNKTTKSNFAHDLNLRFDFSLRNQAAITRDIRTGLSEATTGNRAIKTSFQADYAMSRLVTFALFYDRQRNMPLLSNNSFPTITQDFGFSLKFSLTR
ncbi:MAG: cell surface protein SprA [Bacteroidales bacterium]|nr:cell surface protein SprA [Candidatus Physcousia equi]